MKKAEKYIFATVCCTGVLPYILKSVVMLCKKTALLQWQDVLCDLVAIILAIVFFGLALGAYCQDGKNFPSKKRIRGLLYRGAVLLCVIYITKWGATLLLATGTASIATRAWIGLAVVVLLALLMLWELVKQSMKFAAALFTEEAEWILLRKAWKIWIAILLVLGVTASGKDVLETVIAVSPIVIRGSFLTQVGSKIFLALLIAAVIHKYLCLSREKLIKADIPALEEKEEPGEITEVAIPTSEEVEREPLKKREIVVLVLLFLCIGIETISTYTADAKDTGLYKMAAALEQGKKAADLGKNEVAMQHYQIAETYMQGLEAWLNQEEDTLHELMWNNRFDEFFQQLYYVATKDSSYIESEVCAGVGTETRYHVMLKEYAALEELSEEQAALQRECLDVCISKEYFRENIKWYRAEDWKRNVVKAEIEAYQDKIFYNQILENMIATQKQGGLSKAAVEEMFALAEEHPENQYCQTIAMQYGVKYLSVDKSYKERLQDIALRYDALYEQTTEDKKMLGAAKSYVAQVLMRCGSYEKALEFFADAKDLDIGIETGTCVLNCYYAQGEWEQVQAVAQECLQENSQDSIALYYSALAYLQQNEVTAALEQIKAIEALVLGEEEKDEHMSRLYNFAQQMLIAEDAATYVETLDKEKNPLLYWSVSAINYIYGQGNMEEGQNCLVQIESICPGLSITSYLRGEMAYQQEDYEAAREAYEVYRKTDGENLSVLYALASIYEKQGDYNAAWRTCNRILFLASADVVASEDYELLEQTEELRARVEKEAQE